MFIVCWLVFFIPKDLNKPKGRIVDAYKQKEVEMTKLESVETKEEEGVSMNDLTPSTTDIKIDPSSNNNDTNNTVVEDVKEETPALVPVDHQPTTETSEVSNQEI